MKSTAHGILLAFASVALASCPASATTNGQPFVDLQTQINALTDRVANLEAAAAGQVALTVNCNSGQKIADALAVPGGHLTITAVGTCYENVTIARDDVTLVATPGSGTVSGPMPGASTILVTGARVTIDGLEVTGGRNGITGQGASRLTIQNCNVHGTGRSGIVFFQGSDGTVDSCAITQNPRDGIAVESAAATIIRNNISGNTRVGVNVTNGAGVRLGVDNFNNLALQTNQTYSNDISSNGSAGLFITNSGHGFIGGNQITNNGMDTSNGIRDGVQIFQAQADLLGSNTITDNAANGVLVVSGSVLIVDTVFGVPSGNTIKRNGGGIGVTTANTAGVNGFLNASLDIRNATIESNANNGVTINLQSSARIVGGSISSNNNIGVQLFNGSGAFIQSAFGFPVPTITANPGGNVVCSPPAPGSTETSVLGITLPPTCTGF